MKSLSTGLLIFAALGFLPAISFAQAQGKSQPAEEEGKSNDQKGGQAADDTGEGDEGTGTDTGSGLEDICKIDPAACPNIDMDKEAARQIKEQIFAVQRAFALRVRRFELQPYWSFTLNDQFVSHNAPGASLNYYITNVLAIGVNGNYYRPFNVDSQFNYLLRRAARVGVPLTEYNWSAAFNFTYVPIYGKFAGFQDFIFHYDAYVVGGVGAISVRPIPVIDPDNRNFSYKTRLAFDAGIGLRIFFSRWFAATLEVRDYVFADQLENLEVAGERSPSTGAIIDGDPRNTSTWYAKDTKLTHNVQAQVGVSIFLPTSFEFRLPK